MFPQAAPPAKKRPIKAALFFGFMVMVVIIAFISHLIFNISKDTKNPGMPAWAEMLPGSIEAANEDFDKRAKKQFPAGITEDSLREELSASGFVLFPEEKLAERTDNRGLCNHKRMIVWSRDAQGKITDIKGTFGVICP